MSFTSTRAFLDSNLSHCPSGRANTSQTSFTTALIRSIRLDEAKLERSLSHLVRELGLDVNHNFYDSKKQPIYHILLHMSYIESLTVIHEREDVGNHAPLQQALAKFQHLEAVTLQERNYGPAFPYLPDPDVDVSQTVSSKTS